MAVVRKLNEAAHVYDARERKIEAEIAKISELLDKSPVASPPQWPAQGQQ
ncbi:MAG: hypothetical protein ACRDP6_31885 [Actinoallomurus sp.]